MISKKKTLILVIFLIIGIQTLLLINNRQKTSFRYFIWNIQDVSIGRLICISFASGLLISSILNKTLHKNIRTNPIIEADDKKSDENNFSRNREINNEPYEITPERDLRDTQPTISVNYRVIKNNDDKGLKGGKQTFNNPQNEDDWNNNDCDW